MPKRKSESQLKRDEKPEEQPVDDDEADNNDASDKGSDDSGDGDSDDSNDGGEDEGEDDSDDDDDDNSDEDPFPEASSTEAESEDDDEGEAYKEVNVQFEFFDPQEKDFLGLKALLNTYLDGQQYDCSGLVDAIIKQTAVGTVVKSGEDDDPIAVLTAFNTTRGPAPASTWLSQLKSYLQAKCPDAATREKLDKTFSSAGTALLVSERLVNCPPQLAPPLMQMLMEEIEGAATDEDYPKEARDEFSFQRFLHVTRVYADSQEQQDGLEVGGGGKDAAAAGGAGAGAGAGEGPSSSQPAGPGAKGSKVRAPVIVYVRPEDEYLHQVCSWSFTFSVEGRPVARGELQPLRAVMCVAASRVGEARAMMDLVVGNCMAEAGAVGAGAGAAGPAAKGSDDVKGKGDRTGGPEAATSGGGAAQKCKEGKGAGGKGAGGKGGKAAGR